MQLFHFALRILDDDERATDATAVAGDVNRLLLQVDVDADELVDATGAAELTERPDEARTAARESEDVTVQVDDQVTFGVDLGAVEHVDICRRGSSAHYYFFISSERAAVAAPSTPIKKHMFQIGSSSTSVVMWVMSAKFLTRPHASPSGVSLGQSMPHCDG